MCWQNEPVGMHYAGVSRRTLRRGNEAVGMEQAQVLRRTLRRQNETVGMHYAGVARRTLYRQNDRVGMHSTRVSQGRLHNGNYAVGLRYAGVWRRTLGRPKELSSCTRQGRREGCWAGKRRVSLCTRQRFHGAHCTRKTGSGHARSNSFMEHTTPVRPTD